MAAALSPAGISSAQLVQLIDNDQQVVLVDCRSSIEFATSRVRGALSLGGTRASRRDILSQRVSVRALLAVEGALAGPDYSAAATTTVVYDQSTARASSTHAQSLLYRLVSALATDSDRVFVLEGGFIGFQAQYPARCWVSDLKLPDEDFVVPLCSPLDHLPGPAPSLGGASSGLARSATLMTLSTAASHQTLVSPCQPRSRPLPSVSLSGPALHDTGPTPVLPHLLLGSQQDAMDPVCLRLHRITHILNISPAGAQSPFVPPSRFLRLAVVDNFSDCITDHFPAAFNFLDRVRRSGGRALVHCSAGISRSPTVAIGYLMKTRGWTVSQAYEMVKSSRPSVSPNFNFMGQLTDYENDLTSASAASAASVSANTSTTRQPRRRREPVSQPVLSQQQQQRPKKRPSRLGFLSSLLPVGRRLHMGISSSSSGVDPTSADSSGPGAPVSLLPSPSGPFSRLGINSPVAAEDRSLTCSLVAATVDRFPSTSLERLTFQACQAAPTPRSLKAKRSGTEAVSSTTEISESKVRRCFSVYESGTTNVAPSVTTSVVASPSSPSPRRCASFEKLTNPGLPDSGGIGCRAQEGHQSTSSLSSANSHSSSLLV